MSRARVVQQAGALQDGWADHPASRGLLDTIAGIGGDAPAELGGVATVEEVANAVRSEMPPPDRTDAAPPGREDRPARHRSGRAGRLLRLAAALAGNAVLSGSNELYHRDLPVNDALALALKGAAFWS